jgi:hypothetical protein
VYFRVSGKSVVICTNIVRKVTISTGNSRNRESSRKGSRKRSRKGSRQGSRQGSRKASRESKKAKLKEKTGQKRTGKDTRSERRAQPPVGRVVILLEYVLSDTIRNILRATYKPIHAL